MAESSVRRSSVELEVMWTLWEGPGLEHLRLVTSDGGVVANGLVIGLEAGRPFRIGYEVRCDGLWRVREVRVAAPDSERPVLELLTDGEGHWKRGSGEPLPELDGCIDVDISATPFTNTFPIRRLGLESAESEELMVTYVRVAERIHSRASGRCRGVGDRLPRALPTGVDRVAPADEEIACEFVLLSGRS